MSVKQLEAYRTVQTNVIVRKDMGRGKNKNLDGLVDFDKVAWCELCELAHLHTLLIDKISEKIKTHPDLLNWILQTKNTQSTDPLEDSAEGETKLRQGFLPKGFVKDVYESLKDQPPFREITGRLKDSAIERVEETFASLLESRNTLIKRIKNKQRHLAVIEQDLELAEISSFNQFEIEDKAQQILAQINAEKNLDNNIYGLFGILYKQFDSTDDLLERRAIVHLLTNSGKAIKLPRNTRSRKQKNKKVLEQKGKKYRKNRKRKSKKFQESSEPRTFEEYLQVKRTEIERLKQQLLSQLPKARCLFPDLRFEESLKDLISLPHLSLEEHSLSVLLTYLLMIFQLDTTRYFKLQQYLLEATGPHWKNFNDFFYYLILSFSILLSFDSTSKNSKLGFHLIQSLPSKIEQLVFNSWEDSIQTKLDNFLRDPKSLPYPIGFGYDSVTSWRTNGSGKIFFKLNGLGHLIFEVRCHRRQLPLIKTFLKDWQTKELQPRQQRETEGAYSGTFMALRSIEIMWKPKKRCEGRGSSSCPDYGMFQQYPGQGFWNECDLSIHWTYNANGLTKQGLERLRQHKLQSQSDSLNKKRKELEKRREILSSLEQDLPESSRNDAQIKKIKKLRETIQQLQADLDKPRPKLECLRNSPLFDRPDRPLYKGIDNIFVGVLLDLEKHIVLTVVDAKRSKILAIRSAHSVSEEGYKLRQKYFRQREEHSRQRQVDQKANRYIRRTESGLGQQVASSFANGIVEIAQRYKASTLVIPETKGWRDRLYSQLVARAKIKCNDCKEAMAKYTKAHSIKLHQWDYSRLSKAIDDRATMNGLNVIPTKTTFEEDAFQQAANLAIKAYESLNPTET